MINQEGKKNEAMSGNSIAIGYVVVEHGNAVSLMPALETTTCFVYPA